MDESRFRVASVHHVYTRWVDEQPSGHVCLCGEVMLTHRACTEHVVDAYRADLRTRAHALADDPSESIRDDEDLVEALLALIDGGSDD